MKVAEITYKSDISEFINYNGVKEITSSLINCSLDNINSEVLEVLNNEINKGGLDLYSANINGVPIFHNKAIELQQEVQTVYSNCKSQLEDLTVKAKEHRIDELDKYIEKLKERIDEIGIEIERLETEYEAASTAYDNAVNTINSIPILERPFGSTFTKAQSVMAEKYNAKIIIESEIADKNKELDGGFWSSHKGGLNANLIEATEARAELS